jgi:hypothetical protein
MATARMTMTKIYTLRDLQHQLKSIRPDLEIELLEFDKNKDGLITLHLKSIDDNNEPVKNIAAL